MKSPFYFTKFSNITNEERRKNNIWSTYYVTRIEEPDFGCEGRPEGQEIKDKVYLEEEITKEETIIFMEDKLLYERDINEGMKVVIDGDGRLQKVEDRS